MYRYRRINASKTGKAHQPPWKLIFLLKASIKAYRCMEWSTEHLSAMEIRAFTKNAGKYTIGP